MGADILEIGKSGLFSARKSLQTAGHNIANVNTEGFSRQRTLQSTNVPVGDGQLVFGTGSHIKSVSRLHNDHIEKSLNGTLSEHSYNISRAEHLNGLEGIFNEISTQGLNQILAKFFNSFRELSGQPESETVRSLVRENAKILIRDLRRSNESLINASKTIDKLFEEAVYDINSSLKEIAFLNVKIRELEGLSGESGDLRDQRDMAVRKISDYFVVETYLDNGGKFVVNAKGIGTIVSGENIQQLSTGASFDNPFFPTAREIFFETSPNNPITHKFVMGKLGALYETRKTEIKIMREKIDDLAWQTANSVNAIHRKGFTNREISTTANGELINPENFTGINFFDVPKVRERAAEYIDLSDEVKDDLSNIISSLTPNSPGDNRIALAISKLQQERLAANGTETLEEDYLEGVGIIGLATSKARINEEQSEGILAQTKSIKERLSGVSIDEEAANILRMQQAYEASARIIKVSEEMFKTILGLKN